jgi:hypothetical protein
MAFHEKVYSPDGEMFEVPASRVADLVLQKGWTRSKPELVDIPQTGEKGTAKTVRKSRKSSSTVVPPAEDFDEISQDFPTESDS